MRQQSTSGLWRASFMERQTSIETGVKTDRTVAAAEHYFSGVSSRRITKTKKNVAGNRVPH